MNIENVARAIVTIAGHVAMRYEGVGGEFRIERFEHALAGSELTKRFWPEVHETDIDAFCFEAVMGTTHIFGSVDKFALSGSPRCCLDEMEALISRFSKTYRKIQGSKS